MNKKINKVDVNEFESAVKYFENIMDEVDEYEDFIYSVDDDDDDDTDDDDDYDSIE